MKPVHHTIDWLCQPRVDSGAFASFAQADRQPGGSKALLSEPRDQFGSAVKETTSWLRGCYCKQWRCGHLRGSCIPWTALAFIPAVSGISGDLKLDFWPAVADLIGATGGPSFPASRTERYRRRARLGAGSAGAALDRGEQPELPGCRKQPRREATAPKQSGGNRIHTGPEHGCQQPGGPPGQS